MATIQSLAPELLGAVFHDAELTFSDLWSCALVCRAWSCEAQRALFTGIYLPADDVRRRQLLKSPAFGRYPIKSISFEMAESKIARRVSERQGGIPAVKILSTVKHTYANKFLTCKHFSGITELVLYGRNILPFDLKPTTTRLQTLEFDTTFAHQVYVDTFCALLASSALNFRALVLIGDRFEYTAKLLVALFTRVAFPILTTLHIDASYFVDADHHPFLRPDFDGIIYLLDLLPGVLHFELVGFTGQLVSRISKSFPAALERFSLKVRGGSQMEPDDSKQALRKLVRVLRRPTLQNLRRLTIPALDSSWRDMALLVEALLETPGRSAKLDATCSGEEWDGEHMSDDSEDWSSPSDGADL